MASVSRRASERGRALRDWAAIAALGLANIACFALALFLLFRFLREWA